MKVDELNNTLLNKNINRKIEAFRLLYELKTFSQVAQTMNCSLSTISNLISDLEYYCGAKLFERHGKNGIFITQAGEHLYQKTNNWRKTLINTFQPKSNILNTSNACISIFLHPLFASYYFINCENQFIHLHNHHIFKHTCFHLLVGDKIQVNNYLQNGIDIAVFPFEWGDVGAYKDEYNIYNIRPYEIYLYMNKCNKYATLESHEFTWDILTDANIMPSNREVMFKTASNLINAGSHFFSTNAFDLHFLYQGILHNMWTVAIGNEFEHIFDCSNFVKKSHQLAQKIQFAPYWMILSKKDKNKEEILLETTNLLRKSFNIDR